MAMLAVKNEADALDIVQDSMMKLAHSYGHLQGGDGTDQWRPLFYTILQNCIMDFHRKQSRWRRWFVRQSDDEDEPDVQDKIMDLELNPEQHLQTQQMGKEVLDIIEGLPVQQQQCFFTALLGRAIGTRNRRYYEGQPKQCENSLCSGSAKNTAGDI